MLPSFAKDTVKVIRPGQKSQRGTTIPDWDNATQTEVSGCIVEPAETGLSQDGRVLGITDGATCYMPPQTDVKAGDRIEHEGKAYTIDGEPRRWQSPTGATSSIILNLKRWQG